jgi:hypothetical protein
MLMLVLNFNGRHLIVITVSLLGNRDRDRVSVNDHLCEKNNFSHYYTKKLMIFDE